MPKSFRLIENSESTVTSDGVTVIVAGNVTDFFTPCSSRSPVTVYAFGPFAVSATIFVDAKDAFGNFATSKKSALCRCFVRPSASVKTDAVSISTLTLLSSALPLTRSIDPANLLNPPSCFPVTFEPVNKILEFSGVRARLSPLAGALGADTFDDGVDAFEVTARALFAAGSSQPARKTETDRMTKPIIFIYGFLKDISARCTAQKLRLLNQPVKHPAHPHDPRIEPHHTGREFENKIWRVGNVSELVHKSLPWLVPAPARK